MPPRRPEHTYETFALHQICPVAGWQAVYWDDRNAQHWTSNVPLLALVTRTVREARTRDEVQQWPEDMPDEEKREVVGMEYSDCGFDVCDTSSNFCGLLAPDMTLAEFEDGFCSHKRPAQGQQPQPQEEAPGASA